MQSCVACFSILLDAHKQLYLALTNYPVTYGLLFFPTHQITPCCLDLYIVAYRIQLPRVSLILRF